MAIVAKAGSSNYTPAPAGAHAAVCVDIVDLGALETTYKEKTIKQHKVNIVWQIGELRPDGKPFDVRKRYTLSLHDKAGLRKDLEGWRGKPFSREELEGFDLEILLGKACLLNLIHATTERGTYANVAGIMRLPKDMEAPVQRDYVRVCDRPAVSDGGGWDGQEPPAGWDDVPF